MRRGRSINNFKLKGRGLMKIVKALQRGEGIGAGELGRETFVERIVKDCAASGGVGDKALDDRVPRAADVEHHRRQLKVRVESGRREPARADTSRLAAQPREAERVAQPLRRVDGDNRGVEAAGCARKRERSGNRG